MHTRKHGSNFKQGINQMEEKEIEINVEINDEYKNWIQFCLDHESNINPSFNPKQFQIMKEYILSTYGRK